ncbi:hypothetical protein SNEBB_008605 [Seison nebaliae]|nr:hypothetical protein SNEBB_008605 [Seison nebaliae]
MSWRKASKIGQRNYGERGQLAERLHLGKLEKKNDYLKRAQHQHEKRDVIQKLKEKTYEKNDEEFHFHMINSTTDNKSGEHVDRLKSKDYSFAELQKFQKKDISSLERRLAIEMKKRKQLKSKLAIQLSDLVTNKKIYFVEDDSEMKEIIKREKNKQTRTKIETDEETLLEIKRISHLIRSIKDKLANLSNEHYYLKLQQKGKLKEEVVEFSDDEDDLEKNYEKMKYRIPECIRKK